MKPKKYQDSFYEYHLQGAINSAETIIPLVKEYSSPTSVIDIGCGIGAWLSVWKKSGVNTILGIDGDYVNKSKLLIDKLEFKACNLEQGFASDKKYDLVSCLEVAEHLAGKYASGFIESLCKLGDVILFSAAIPGQEGTMHVNEQYPDYWVNIFHKQGFVPIDCLRQWIWDDKKIEWWYRQNILFFVKGEALSNYPGLLKQYDAAAKILTLVHPVLFEEKNRKVLYYEELLNSPFQTLKHGLKRIFKKN
jgi:hypothetical protein